MAPGVRATVRFREWVPCPAATVSRVTGTDPEQVTHCLCPGDSVEAVTEIAVETPTDPPVEEVLSEYAVATVFTRGSTRWYRVRQGDRECPCVTLARLGIPVVRRAVHDGRVTVEFHAADHDRLRTAVERLRERFPSLEVRRLGRASDDPTATDTVPVDRARLTDCQREALATAHRMGYFERPRDANATAVAAELEIDPSTFSEHLAAAQRKLLADVFR